MLAVTAHIARHCAGGPSARLVQRAAMWMTYRSRRTDTHPPRVHMFDKILVANRGEIALRVMRTARRLGVTTVAVYSDADAQAWHVEEADVAYRLGPAPAHESYLRLGTIVEIAKRSGAQAIHPGYGFLSENAAFSELCDHEGITFIGPPASAIRAMGSKSESKAIMEHAGVPVVPGYHGDDQSQERLITEAKRIGFPVMIKAIMGGGGKGMRIVNRQENFDDMLHAARREAMASFGDDRVLVEKFIVSPRHIEFQIFCDEHGNAVHMFERDCSVQRRHQKVLEESPAPGLSPAVRAQMGETAVQAAKAVGYVGAGTVEFIVEENLQNYYFMEMNTRLQVEHAVTEMITKLDLVEWQLLVAAGFVLPLQQEQIHMAGHAVEARIYAENPDSGFLPGAGHLVHLKQPTSMDGIVRIDAGVRAGDDVTIFYDPMIAKLICWGGDRVEALRRLRRALEDYKVVGVPTNVKFLRECASHIEFLRGNVNTSFIDTHKKDLFPPVKNVSPDGIALGVLAILLRERKQISRVDDGPSPWGIPHARRVNMDCVRVISLTSSNKEMLIPLRYLPNGQYEMTLMGAGKVIVHGTMDEEGDIDATIGDKRCRATVAFHEREVHVFTSGENYFLKLPASGLERGDETAGLGSLASPMPGRIVKVHVKPGDFVTKNAPVIVMEAMKMEHVVCAPFTGRVSTIHHGAGEFVGGDVVLAVLAEETDTMEASNA